MNYLTVIRHANAEFAEPGEDDIARHLTDDGLAAAFRLGQLLAGKECVPDLLLASAAQRARETADQILRALNLADSRVEIVPEFYAGDEKCVLEILASIPADTHHVFVIGHNPTLTDLVNLLCGASIKNMDPGSAACIKLDISTGGETGIGAGELQFYIES